MKIYFKGGNKYKTLYGLLRRFYYKGSKTTYKNRICSRHECGSHHRRSFEALLDLSTTYFPKTTPKELITTLKRISENNTRRRLNKLVVHNCPQIKASVITDYYYGNNTHDHFFSDFSYRYDGKNPYAHKVEGKYSIKELEELYES